MTYKRCRLRSLILEQIEKGDIDVGDQLPTESQMVQQYGMSRATVREGIALLVQEGILARRRGAGTFVQSIKPRSDNKLLAAIVACQPGGWDNFGQVVHEIEARVHEQGYSLIVCNHESSREKTQAHLQRIIEQRVGGVIFSPIQLPGFTDFNLQVVQTLEDKGIPFVLIASPISGESLCRYSFVSSNGFAATREIVRHLAGLGHRRIAYIRGLPEVFSADQRFSGFCEEMKRQNLDMPDGYIRQIEVGPVEDQGRREVRELLAQSPSPSAVVCIHDSVARNVIEEVQSMGLSVPADLAVVGFDDLYFAAELNPPLTTVRTPLPDEAAMDVAILFKKINGTLTGERQEFLPCELVIRESCGAPPKLRASKIIRAASPAVATPL
ncbi:MAG: GntR family transcriptional regulator [Phycisphaerae bacterium]|nr:GntR family transcriptional regulator [Phycisphaerae bacterium]